MSDSNFIGTRLKIARHNTNLTQMQVMKLTKISNKTLSNYEKGVTKPDLESLIILSKLYMTTTDYLLCLTDKQHTDELRRLQSLAINKPDTYCDHLSPEEQAAMQAFLEMYRKQYQQFNKVTDAKVNPS